MYSDKNVIAFHILHRRFHIILIHPFFHIWKGLSKNSLKNILITFTKSNIRKTFIILSSDCSIFDDFYIKSHYYCEITELCKIYEVVIKIVYFSDYTFINEILSKKSVSVTVPN